MTEPKKKIKPQQFKSAGVGSVFQFTYKNAPENFIPYYWIKVNEKGYISTNALVNNKMNPSAKILLIASVNTPIIIVDKISVRTVV